MLKLLSATIFINVLFSTIVTAQCTAPGSPPTDLKLTAVVKSIGITFNPSSTEGGVQAADKYLVLISTDETLEEQPADGKEYRKDQEIKNAKVIDYGTSTSYSIGNLAPGKYHIFVFAANSAGNCYNKNPLTGETELSAPQSTGQTEDPAKPNEVSSKLSALLNFNFVGNQNNWSNLTPIVFYGWNLNGYVKKGKKPTTGEDNRKKIWGSMFQLGPYVGSTIAIKDSTSFLPALMLAGNAGLEGNYYMTFGDDSKLSVTVSPLNLGLKVISGFKDSSIAIVQHNLRHFIGLRYGDYVSFSVQYTRGWHNSTTHSKENYVKVFSGTSSKVAYWTLGLTTRLSKDLLGSDNAPVYLHINWRTFAKPTNAYNLPNSRFISVGIIASLDLKSGTNPALMPKAPHINL